MKVDGQEEARLNALMVRRWVRRVREAWAEKDVARLVRLMGEQGAAVEARAASVVGALTDEPDDEGAR